MYPLTKGLTAKQAQVGLPGGTYEEEHGRKGSYGKSAHLYVSDALFDNFSIDPDILRPIGRMSGSVYSRTTDRFILERPAITHP